MDISAVNEDLIHRINSRDEKAFAFLYEAYYVYLNTIAIYYVKDRNIGGELVDDVFINIWNKKFTLTYPVHSFLIRCVQNACLNYIRNQQALERVHEGHLEEQLSFQENHILYTPVPLQYMELQDMEAQIRQAIEELPSQCKAVFKSYYYSGKKADEIAAELNINVNTVRVQLKRGIDKLKILLKHLLVFFF